MVRFHTFTASSIASALALALTSGCLVETEANTELDLLDEAEDSSDPEPTLETTADLNTSRHTLATHTTELSATQDTFVLSTAPHQTRSDQLNLKMRRDGTPRILVQFDQASIDAAIGDDELLSATLVLPIESPADGWTPSGGTLDLHRMTTAWTNDATWMCPDDADTSNTQADCTPGWELGGAGTPPYEVTPTASLLVNGGDSGSLEFDVTTDVLGGDVSDGWVLRKTLPDQSGRIRFWSSESGSGPTLVLDVLEDECPDDPNKTEPGECGCGFIEFDATCYLPCPDYDDPIAHIENLLDAVDEGGCIGELTMTCDGSTIAFSGAGGTYGSFSGEIERPGSLYGTAGGAQYTYTHCEEILGSANAVSAFGGSPYPLMCQSLFDDACASLPAP